MAHYSYVVSVQIIVLIVCSSMTQLTSTSFSINKLLESENEEILNIVKEEFDQFRIDLTKSFMQAHSRRKRAHGNHFNDIEIKSNGKFEEFAVDSVGPFSTFTFAGHPYVIQNDGIYEVAGLKALSATKAVSRENALIKKGAWKLRENESVLNGFEWKHSFFLVTSTGKFSSIYTLHEHSLKPILRQNIQNKANAADAELFEYRGDLYMIMLNDNEGHSMTFSPVFRWAGSYMDEIHQIQTTGASAVKTFEMNSKQYIAIAQSKDATGNSQVGTMVLSMDHMDRLERVQLLWSDGANKLQYMQTDKELFLVVGQKAEPSIVYWFGGTDFVLWQQFDGLHGENLVMESHQLTSDEPLLLTSNGGAIKVFSRSRSTTKILATWAPTKTLDLFGTERLDSSSDSGSHSGKISQLKILRVGSGGDNVFLAITKPISGSHKESLRFYPVKYIKTERGETHAKIKVDMLSSCMDNLKATLDNSEESLARIDALSDTVLTTDGDWTFGGEVITSKITKPASSLVQSAEISPVNARGGNDPGNFKTAPSVLLSRAKENNDNIAALKTQLSKAVYKTKQSDVITGNLEFVHGVLFDQMDATDNTDLQFESINGVSRENLENFALKKNSADLQQVTGSWNVDSITTHTFESSTSDSKLTAENFLLTTCSEEAQSTSGVHEFSKHLTISELTLHSINGIQFSDIVFKDNPAQEISGFKHAPLVTGTFKENFVNEKNLENWFANVANISGTKPQQITGHIETSKDVEFVVENLVVNSMNGKTWHEFENSVMLNGATENVEGLLEMEDVTTNKLEVPSISGISSDALLTGGKAQKITSHFTAENVEIADVLSSEAINGIKLGDAVSRKEEAVTINGPVMLENFHVQEVVVPENVMIADKDVSELKNFKRVHEYFTADGGPVIFQQANIEKLTTGHINGETVDDLKSMYWSKKGNNVANPAQLVLDSRHISVGPGSFQTGKLNHFTFPQEFVSLHDDHVVLVAPLQFKGPVRAEKNVTMGKNVKFAGYDMSEAESMIVDDKFKGQIRGLKTFQFPVTATHGAHITALNGRNPTNDVVLRNSAEVQRIEGNLTFEKATMSDQFAVKDGDVRVDGLVNNIDLKEVKRTTVYKNEENFIQGNLEFDRGVKVDRFSTSHANNVNVKEVTDNLILLDGREVQTFEGHVTLKNGNADFLTHSIAGTMNNVPVNEYLSQVVRMDTNGGELIRGMKTFTNMKLTDKLFCNTVNEVGIKNLERNALSKSKPQNIIGKWTFKDVEFGENLDSDKIEGISLDNLVFVDQPATVSSHVEFMSENIGIEGPVSVPGNVNGIKLNENVLEALFIDGAHEFREVIVDGDVNWSKDRPELQQASYFFQNAVKKTGPQTITGIVSFTQGFHSSELITTEKWLANVDLKQIRDDAIIIDSADVTITGLNEFADPLTIQNLSSNVTNLDIKKVNNVDLKSMSEDIVQTDDNPKEKLITGKKRLRGDVKAKKLNVKGNISDVPAQELVSVDHPAEIQRAQFNNIDIEENIESETVDGFDLKSLLDDRVSLTRQNQNLQGHYTFLQNINVKDSSDCHLMDVNNVTIKNIMRKEDLKKHQQISGTKTFKNLTVEGDWETPSLNNQPISALMNSSLRMDKETILTRPVIFEGPVTINKAMQVESINGINQESFSSLMSDQIRALAQDSGDPGSLSEELDLQTINLQHISEERPTWLEYLRVKHDMTGMNLGAQSRVSHIQMEDSEEILVTLHRDTDGQQKGLPNGCHCNSVITMKLDDFSGRTKSSRKDNGVVKEDKCLSVYNVVSSNKRSYIVTSEAVSSNTSCVTENDGATKIFQGNREVGSMALGHISDVGVFSQKDIDFLVLAQYFDKTTASHSTVTRVMRVNQNGDLEKVQDIETHGARKIALTQIDEIWMLAIANSKSSTDENSCNAESAIYKWSHDINQFRLTRTIMTDGAFDVQFITTETSTEFYKQSFVAFAQEGNSASGEVMIFKFEQPEALFMMFQTIRPNWAVTGLSTWCMCKKCYMVTTIPQEGITFYENRFVEGFKEYYKAPILGATDISSFQVGNHHLFAIATNKGPILAEAVISGSCN